MMTIGNRQANYVAMSNIVSVVKEKEKSCLKRDFSEIKNSRRKK